MEVTLRIKDSTYKVYKTNAETRTEQQRKANTNATYQVPDTPPEQLIQDVVEHFCSVSDSKGWLVINPRDRAQLEALIHSGSIRTGDELVTRLKKRLEASIGPVTLRLSSGQHAKIRRMAEREKKDPKKFLETVCEKISNELIGMVG